MELRLRVECVSRVCEASLAVSLEVELTSGVRKWNLEEDLGSRVQVQSLSRACELRSEGNALSDWTSNVVKRDIVQTKCWEGAVCAEPV